MLSVGIDCNLHVRGCALHALVIRIHNYMVVTPNTAIIVD